MSSLHKNVYFKIEYKIHMYRYLWSFVYEYTNLVEPKCDYYQDVPIYRYDNKPVSRLRLVPYSYQSGPGRWLTGYRYESYPDTTLTAVPTGNTWKMYIIKDANHWYFTSQNNIPLNNTTKVFSILCSALLFVTNGEKYINYFGFGDLACKFSIAAFLVAMYWFSKQIK